MVGRQLGSELILFSVNLIRKTEKKGKEGTREEEIDIMKDPGERLLGL